MKVVLISIHPRHCENIASGKKTVEVRKTKPKLETPFKCYIYMTKSGNNALEIFEQDGNSYAHSVNYHMAGKVIGEFICDFFDEFEKGKGVKFKRFMALHETCLDVNSILQYIGTNDMIYGWHISDLKIYDNPKELSDFRVPCRCLCINCTNPLYDTGVCEERGTKKLTRPPQSWMYVEEA